MSIAAGHRVHHPAVCRDVGAADLDLATVRRLDAAGCRPNNATASAIAMGCVLVRAHLGVTIAGKPLDEVEDG